MSEVASSAKRGASLSRAVEWFMKEIFIPEIEHEIAISLLEALPLPVYGDQGRARDASMEISAWIEH